MWRRASLTCAPRSHGQVVVSRIPSVELRQAAPLCLGYHYDSSHAREMLVIGDDSGGITLYNFKSGWHICDGTLPCHSTLQTCAYAIKAKARRKRRMPPVKKDGPISHARALRDLAHPIQPMRFSDNEGCRHTDHVVQASVRRRRGMQPPPPRPYAHAASHPTCRVPNAARTDCPRLELRRDRKLGHHLPGHRP